MIEVLINTYFGDRGFWHTKQPNPSLTEHNRIYGRNWAGLWGTEHPLGRHPFNIITEEVLSD